MKLLLASSSPRRAELLERLDLVFTAVPADIDETRRPDESPGVYVERLAREKALAVAGTDLVVIAADTAVVHEGKVLGKPAHPQEARAMLTGLQGAEHEVFTGLAVATAEDLASTVDITEVRMLPMTEDEIYTYVETGEPMDKAGSYGLQGKGGAFVEAISGSPFTVIGLPIHLIPRLMRKVGVVPEQFVKRSNL